MTVHTGAASVTDKVLFLAPASKQSEHSFIGRFINVLRGGRECKGDQYSPRHQAKYQSDFRIEFERRLLGQ